MYIIYLVTLLLSFIFLRIKLTYKSEYSLICIWLIIFVFLGTYAYFSDDYEPYADIVTEAYINPWAKYTIEPFWVWLADYTKGNIDLYRFIVFSLIAILLLLIRKISHIEMKYLVIYYTFFCMLSHFTGIRQALNMMLCLYGILLCFNNHWVIGILCIVLSSFLHKSGIMFALLLLFGLLPVSKKTFVFSLLLFPFLYAIFYFILNSSSMLPSLLFLQSYAESEGEYANRHIIMQLLSGAHALCNFLLVLLTIVYFQNHSDRLVKLLVRCLFGVFLTSIFFFLSPMETNVIYKRLLWFGMILLVIIWSRCIQNKLLTRKYTYLLLLFLLCTGISVATMLGNNYWRMEILTKIP